MFFLKECLAHVVPDWWENSEGQVVQGQEACKGCQDLNVDAGHFPAVKAQAQKLPREVAARAKTEAQRKDRKG